MKILVTGGAGFVGTNLIKRLLRDGHEVVSVDNYSTGYKHNEQDGCLYSEVDISNASRLKAKLFWAFEKDKPDMIFHLAALARIQPSFKNPQEVFEVNVLGTQHILEWARTNGNIPVVYAGSSSSHGDHFANPYTYYKFSGEELCRLYASVYKLPTAVTRFYNVYGKHMIPKDSAYSAVIQIFDEQKLNGEPLTITGDGEQRRDFTHVEDIVDGLIRCGMGLSSSDDRVVISGKTFELGRGKNYSINEIASFYDSETTYIEQRPGEMRITLCESVEAREMLGFNPTKSIEDYIKDIVKKSNE